MPVTLIAALAKNRAIGYRNRLLYFISADLKRFKALTTGHTVIMGRKTFESLPKGPLPNRRNIVLSRRPGLRIDGAEVFATLDAALATCAADEDIFIIGGASLYEQALPLAHRLCLTHIDALPSEADAFFPAYAPDEWRLTASEPHTPDEKNPYSFTFSDYERI